MTQAITIPNLMQSPVVEKRPDGKYYFTAEMFNTLSQLIIFLQQNFSQEGLKAPLQTTANVTALNTALSTSAILYDSQTDEFKGCVNGIFKTFTLT